MRGPKAEFLKQSEHQNHLEGLLSHRALLGPHPQFLIQDGWGGYQESAIPTSSQVMLLLLPGTPKITAFR